MPASTTARAATKTHRNFRGGAPLVLHLPRGECGRLATWKFAIAGPRLPSLWDGVWSWGPPWQRANSSTCGTSRLTTLAWPTAGWWCGWTAGISTGERFRLAATWCARASWDSNAALCGAWLPGDATANERAALSIARRAGCDVPGRELVWVVRLRPSALTVSRGPVVPVSRDLSAKSWWEKSLRGALFELFSRGPGYVVSGFWGPFRGLLRSCCGQRLTVCFCFIMIRDWTGHRNTEI